jgi:uncharacterized oligopeptide transporter (OPT) family protein
MNETKRIGIAPADARPHAAWPVWKKVLAYLVMSAVSLAAIWFVDVKVHRDAVMPRSPNASLRDGR